MPEDYFLQVPNEIFFMIFLRLSVLELTPCMRVCRRFKTILESQDFWRMYLKLNYNFIPVDLDGEMSESAGYDNLISFIAEEWECLWDESEENPPANDPSRYIFRPLPRVWDNGIITPCNFQPFSGIGDYYAFTKAIHSLLALRTKCVDDLIFTLPYLSTMHCMPDVCLFAWPKEGLPEPQEVLEIFNVHKEIITNSDYTGLVYASDKLDYVLDKEVDDGLRNELLNNSFHAGHKSRQEAEKIFQWLQNFFQPSLMFCTGVDTIDPQLYFHLTILSPGWVGGIFQWVELF